MKAKAQTLVYTWRYRFVVSVLVLVACSVIARSIHLHVFEGDFLIGQGDKRYLRNEPLPAHRGVIYDRAGKPLAISTAVTTIWINPLQLSEHPDQWQRLADVMAKPYVELRDKIVKNQSKEFLYLRRHMAPDAAKKILALKIPGVYSMHEYRRYYPAGEVAAHLVGFTNIDNRGQEGIELAYDEQLRGVQGVQRVVKNRLGKVVKDLGVVKSPRPGTDLHLSIDLRSQYLAYKELLSAVKVNRAKAGSVVVVDVRSGDIVAAVNYPTYNPNTRENLNSNNMRNRAFTDVFEPGSTMKPFTVVAGLESGMFFPDTKIDTAPGYMRVGRKLIRDHRNYGEIDVTNVITKSSNIGSTKIALALQEGALTEMFGRVGFGQHSGTGFPGESVGLLPVRDKWREIETATMSYGYGLSVNAVQLAQAYAVIANQGVKQPLSLLKSAGGRSMSAGETVIDPKVAAQVTRMLETVVTKEGTANKASVEGYRVAGKTGTVHKIANGAYIQDRYLSLFAGFAPATNPELVMVVVVDDPKGEEYYGGAVAAPVFSKVMERLLRHNNIEPDQPEAEWMMLSKVEY